MTSPVRHITFDCLDPYTLAGFWAEVVGGRRESDDHPGDPSALVTHGGTPLLFEQVPEGKSGKNRVHLDLIPLLPRAQEVERLRGLGATVLADHIRPDGWGWVVMADPEGNELCVELSGAERSRFHSGAERGQFHSGAERGRPGTGSEGGEPAAPDRGERQMPPIHAAAERTMLEGMLEWYREGVVAKVDGLAQADATSSPLRSGTTAAGLVKHLALVEDSWFTHGLAQRPEPEPWAGAPFDDDPDWEFHSANDEPLEQAVALYRAAGDRSREVAAGRDLDDSAVNARGRRFSLRFVYLHLIEETARHLGHLDILRELADGSTGE